MKKTILVVLLAVMIATPCLAQEIEPDGLFSIEGTEWQASTALLILPFPWISPIGLNIGFWDGEVYEQSRNPRKSFYVDMLAVSIFMYVGGGGPFVVIAFGIMQPIGIGMMMEYWVTFPPYSFTGIFPSHSLAIMPLIKTDDNWIPEETISSVYPYNFGEQGTTMPVIIWFVNTTLQDDPPVEISFDPPDGLTVSNIEVRDNTEIIFDLEIAVDAPIGYRDVIVTYDDGNKVITGIDAFEVLEKTN